ncbi:sulfate transporter [Bacillus pseudomycoides]|uniref:SulP family inorganic anion transporter n=1 Tax=Bacillus pseudomycoides TaxID=64104 RepID=UPI000BEE42AA|nr:SulP family inorganic anion transporter [Bacillus pseudomycoides]PDY44616.1 sulfate transporter [Bacillus pseudomycoides]PEA82346.1 sulfate transporter [Bacillus pseudomycoides]PED71348.1 sulfate transporter [Bacillus pseudomycoides]PEI40561.1 sulfate transporter [Bacillus pseudomycoides]PEJ80015.1 sulfate transporter [Bacillus pseudomycoides]
MVQKIAKECLAGFTVAIVALPLAIAFGIAATGTSEGALVGLYGAIFAGLFAALFGGTAGQVTGPTGPITVIATGVIATHGLEASFIAFMMAGLFQILFGVCKLGAYIRYIPYSVVSGFMNGIALIIILGEMKHVKNSFLLVLLTILVMLVAGKWIKAIPASLIALVGVTATLPLFAHILQGLTIQLPFVGTIPLNKMIEKIGAIPEAIPSLHVPSFSGSVVLELIFPALSIALLGSIDSLLTSVVMDNVTGTRHKSNKELIGQGLGNIMSGLFGGLAGAGATVRSIVNIRSGGKTALSACMHSIILFIFIIGLGAVVQYIPLAVLSGILILTGIGMFDWDSMKKMHVAPKGDTVVMLLTMVITVKFDLMIAVAFGIVLSFILYMVQCKERKASIVKEEGEDALYMIRGPLSFLSVDRIFSSLQEVKSHLTLRLNDVHYMDTSGAMALLNFVDHTEKMGASVTLEHLQPHVEQTLLSLANDEQRKKLQMVNEK